MTTTCLHVITTRPKICDVCNEQVQPQAQLAARLRGRYGTDAPAFVANHGETELTLVRGDEVANVTVMVRERRESDVVAADDLVRLPATQLVAEVVKGATLGSLEYRPGDVFEVKVGVGEVVIPERGGNDNDEVMN